MAGQHNPDRIQGLPTILGRRKVHGLEQLESTGLPAHGEHGGGGDRDVHGRHDHRPIRHDYHAH